MNKLVKGSIAAAAGIALLLGGAGTFALWNANTEVAAASVTSGTLALTPSGTGTWTDITNGRNAAISDVSQFKIVPGNKLRFTQTMKIDASGNDLVADLTYSAASITGSLKNVAVTTMGVSSAAGSSALPAGVTADTATAGSFVVRPVAAGSTTAVVTFVVELPQATDGAASMNGTLDLSKLTFTLKQRAIA
ncbi:MULTISPECIES: alternate-type signal peptide domain-containing protein [Frigoribacterium]|uniref:alternate-type signal peptide domain-containing protein n=1 Tax=Frigoribacterium TaxID=96492 RepID=UPI00177DCDB9|nr:MULTISPECIES: alternate-type signal peptide domain-containing protein [Frigoribacterium]MBD8702349.1 alternate-type signal peptide domain-containing protein [Frigoribacterium sp. CFBP 13712]MCJ0701819.1 alternate-type signal peptide domain-containing protein [Frigoribacterium faeni]MDY0891372.1 alternate-type signal peptide domain-containing protein [Frigoribacterium sp. CFBP9030]